MKLTPPSPHTAFIHTRKYSYIVIILSVLLCAVSVGVSFWSINRSEILHGDLIRSQIYELKKSFLKDSVDNMISHIDAVRESILDQEKQRAQNLAHVIGFLLSENSEASLQRIKASAEQEKFSCTVHNLNTDQKIYVIQEIPSNKIAAYVSVKVTNYEIVCGIPQDVVDEITKKMIHDEIHAQKFHNNSYMWVNEIINWDGGEGYAVRKIHPNLKDTEGMLLSTYTEDIKGNKPYLEELEGVRENGSLFSRYYFKRLESSEISEKLTYASVYKDFNWIVAMGIHVDDLEYYIQEIKKSSDELNTQVYIITAVIIILFFTAFIALVTITGLKYIKQTRAEIRSEANRDPLTGALNRRIGNEVLRKKFIQFKQGKRSPLIFSIDIDNFKQINDVYGHDAGDIVLRKLVKVIRGTMRETDFLFRWGGEEFLVVYDAENTQLDFLAGRLNTAVENKVMEITHFQQNITNFAGFDTLNPQNTVNSDNEGMKTAKDAVSITISIGVSWYSNLDQSFHNAVKRSDIALYDAKLNGKNTYRVQNP
ncbi:MAG TPA: sensor domain-containing diguanylate cyclase [Treponemataceae bacterium]|nr:sensor domain-containing diguanylate cyclase [Treponemataceae bacterium]HQL04572.1 sensor domain-containing diguanylate cyclase [Treponemataceae bacterium]